MTARAAHTPGPWKWVGDNLEGANYADAIYLTVACGRWCEGGTAKAEISAADRALIAAAPTMLDALYAALDFVEEQEDIRDGDDGHQLPNSAMVLARTLREAIEKAGGSL